MRVLAAVIALAGAVGLWMVVTVDVVSADELDTAHLLFLWNTPNIALGLWVLGTGGSVVLRPRYPVMSRGLGALASSVVFLASGYELLLLQRGASIFEFPEAQVFAIYASAFLWTGLLMAFGLIGIAIQLALYDKALR